jgi:hypothetical protein
MEVLKRAKRAKNAPFYICNICDYKCYKKSDIQRHHSTDKHKRNADGSIGSILEVNVNADIYDCICGKIYETHGGFWKHKQKCKYQSLHNNNNNNDNNNNDTNATNTANDIDNNPTITDNNNDDITNENIIINSSTPLSSTTDKELIRFMIKEHEDFKNMILDVFKNNNEFQKQMFELVKNNNSINYNNNSNNNTFNLQVFLNEQCKDAMNINDFVDSFDLQISDLENVGRLGYVEGMSNIIITKMRELDVHKRPIHCSDLKREVIYIKDEDKWEREDSKNTKFRKVIKRVSGKNIGMLNAWKERHPDCLDSDSIYNDIYMKLIIAAMGANDIEGNENKIIKKIAKEVVIDKKLYSK